MPLCITRGWIEKEEPGTAIDARIHHRVVDPLKGFLDVMWSNQVPEGTTQGSDLAKGFNSRCDV